MAIPDYQTIMLPLLKFASDSNEHRIREVIDSLANTFNLSSEEKRMRLPSGADILFDNKVRWANLYVTRAGLLESTRRGFFKITERGLTALAQKPERIDIKFLQQYPEFSEWRNVTTKKQPEALKVEKAIIAEKTPEEALEYGYQQMQQNLEQQLLSIVKAASFTFFEKLVVELLVKMGYGGSIKDAGRVVGGVGDEGIDGVIKEDKLGLDTIYIQAKNWENTSVGRPELQKFVGALQEKRANKGVFITTSTFAKTAYEYIEKIGSKVVLIDGEKLAELMIENNVGVSPIALYEVKRIDTDYFSEE